MPPRPGHRRKNYELEPSENKKGPKAVNPHSPWQLMIETSRSLQSISMRHLAHSAKIPPATIFNWVRAKTGDPPRSSYPQATNNHIADTLGVEPTKLWEAYESSLKSVIQPHSVEDVGGESDSAKPVDRDPIEILLAMLKSASRSQFTLSEIEAVAEVASSSKP